MVTVASNIGQAMPELRLEMAKAAVDAAPEPAIHVAQYYAHVLAEAHDNVDSDNSINGLS